MLFDETADLTSSEGEMEGVGDGGEHHHRHLQRNGDKGDNDDNDLDGDGDNDDDDDDGTFAQRKRARLTDDHEGDLMEAAGIDKHMEDNHMEVEDPVWLAGT
jgi:hypothetical protein